MKTCRSYGYIVSRHQRDCHEAADTTADRVAVNAATIVNEAANSVTGRVSAISDDAEGLVGA